MSVILSSTTDGPDEVKRALESAGQSVESMDVFSNELPAVEEKTDPSAPAESPAPAAGKPGEGKTADESETPEDTEAATEDEESAEEETEEETKPQDTTKKRGGVEKKIDRLTREKAKLAEERSERDGRIVELQRQVEALSKQKEPEADKPAAAAEPEKKAPESKTPRPQLADFETHEEWMEKLLEWKDEQHELKLNTELGKLRSELAAKDAQQTEQSATQARMNEWFERVNDVKTERYADWDEVATKGKDVLFSPAMQEVMFESELGPDMLYFLTSNPEIAKKIFEKTSCDDKATVAQALKANRIAGVEMARVESIVRSKIAEAEENPDSDKPEEKPAATSITKPKVTAAPAPIKPNKGAAAGSKPTPYEAKMTFKEYQEWYRESHQRRA